MSINRKKNVETYSAEIIDEPVEDENDNKEDQAEVQIDYDSIIDMILSEFIVNRASFINSVERGIKQKKELNNEILIFLRNNEIFLNKAQTIELLKRFQTYVWGYGVLQDLIDDEDVTDIKTIDYDNIRIKIKGRRQKANIKFSNRESLKKYINYIATKNNSMLSEINAIQKFTDKNSSNKFILRINISSEFVNSNELPCLIIRKIPKDKYRLDKLMQLDMFNDDIKSYLREAINGGLTMFFTGKGASGKTTLMNALIDEIPKNASCLVIQEAEELFTNVHPDMIFQKVKQAKGDGKIQYSLRDLSVNGLLSDIDYFIIGEIKGGEAYDMANAIYTGHIGLASVHGNSAEEAVNKIVHYTKYVSDMKKGELLEMLSNIDVLIFMKDFRIMQISEVCGFDYEKQNLIFNRVYEYQISEKEDGYTSDFIKINDSCDKVKNKKKYCDFRNSTTGE